MNLLAHFGQLVVWLKCACLLQTACPCVATFEAVTGVRDDKATAQVKLFGDNLQFLEKNLPLDNAYKSKDVIAAPIRVIQLIYNAGDVKGPQTVAFNLPNDERIVKDRGTSMVMLKNVSKAKLKHILQPIADACIEKEQREPVDFESFFTHTICHECCHGIGPHILQHFLMELEEQHSALEEAKADMVGLWALKFLISKVTFNLPGLCFGPPLPITNSCAPVAPLQRRCCTASAPLLHRYAIAALLLQREIVKWKNFKGTQD
ncbi:hypothetical protein SLEP1_g56287 [Rubroshorea leprosula]|uniref:Nudix hydrolase 3 n=1 Tax=Rubroshorea leprosula TaxID=152421 RepID=A0AAV5MK81_9ROSI|nr:hypothetical protein SLEP1_g56287 [Rubroshorea leprosula]